MSHVDIVDDSEVETDEDMAGIDGDMDMEIDDYQDLLEEAHGKYGNGKPEFCVYETRPVPFSCLTVRKSPILSSKNGLVEDTGTGS
jgi:hypothetical protein